MKRILIGLVMLGMLLAAVPTTAVAASHSRVTCNYSESFPTCYTVWYNPDPVYPHCEAPTHLKVRIQARSEIPMQLTNRTVRVVWNNVSWTEEQNFTKFTKVNNEWTNMATLHLYGPTQIDYLVGSVEAYWWPYLDPKLQIKLVEQCVQ